MFSERRRHLWLRESIDHLRQPQKEAITYVARMLGPDELKVVESELKRKAPLLNSSKNPIRVEAAAIALRLRHDELPREVLSMRLEWFGISDATKASLGEAGLRTAGDFVTKTKNELLEDFHVPQSAADEARMKLLGYGIRTVENPPMR